jgi:hypothetical protein
VTWFIFSVIVTVVHTEKTRSMAIAVAMLTTTTPLLDRLIFCGQLKKSESYLFVCFKGIFLNAQDLHELAKGHVVYTAVGGRC